MTTEVVEESFNPVGPNRSWELKQAKNRYSKKSRKKRKNEAMIGPITNYTYREAENGSLLMDANRSSKE